MFCYDKLIASCLMETASKPLIVWLARALQFGKIWLVDAKWNKIQKTATTTTTEKQLKWRTVTLLKWLFRVAFFSSSSFPLLPHLAVHLLRFSNIHTVLQHFPFDTVHAPAKIYQIRVNYEISSVWVHLSVNMYIRLLFPCARHTFSRALAILVVDSVLFFLLLLFSSSFFSSCFLPIFVSFCVFFYQLVFPFCLYQMHAQSRARQTILGVYFKWPGAECSLAHSLYLYLYFRCDETHTYYA